MRRRHKKFCSEGVCLDLLLINTVARFLIPIYYFVYMDIITKIITMQNMMC